MSVLKFVLSGGAEGGVRVGGRDDCTGLSEGIGFRSTCWGSLSGLASEVNMDGRNWESLFRRDGGFESNVIVAVFGANGSFSSLTDSKGMDGEDLEEEE